MRYPSCLLCVLALLAPGGAEARDPRKDALQTTFLEYSRNLVAHYPEALARRIRDMQRRARVELPPEDLCRRAIEALPAELEDNPDRRVVLVASGPLGQPPDAWERAALEQVTENRDNEHHEMVKTLGGTMFRYLAPLDGLPPPCAELTAEAVRPAAVSITRRAGPRRQEADALPAREPAELRLPRPSRQGPRR